MIIKDEVKNIIYDGAKYHIYGLKNNDKFLIKFDPEFTISKGLTLEIEGDIVNESRGPIFVASNIKKINKIDTINLLELAIDGIGEKKAKEIMDEIRDYQVLKDNPFKIFDFFITPKNKEILEQIKANREEIIKYEDKEDAAKYMGKIIKGIGKKKVLQWMDEFEKEYPYDTYLFTEEDLIIKFLVSETAMNVYEQIKHFDKIEEQFKILNDLNIPAYIINYLFKDYKADTLNTIKENPYILLNYNLAFSFVDNIAINRFGFNEDSYDRIINAILYVIKDAEKEGHTFIMQNEALDKAMEYLNIDDSTIAINYNKELKKEKDPEFILDGKKLYRRVIYFTERKLGHLLYQKTIQPEIEVPQYILDYLKTTTLSDEQKSAVENMLKRKISILTGGPGTGKTTTINELCNCLKKMNKKFLLCAPTGRAAKRMTETTGCVSQTIHRLLEYKPRGAFGSFLRNEKYPLRTDYIIVDESSMLDVYILNSLIKAVSFSTSIIFVGDINQLPSISMGSVFKDMCDSKQIKVNYLTKVYRQSLDSYIVRNAYNIQDNKELELNDDFKFYKINEFEEIHDILKDIDYEYQVLCPMRVGRIGTITINQLCQDMLNGKEEQKVFANGKFFKVGDKVIQLDNNYNKEVYNGELGIIKEILPDKVTVFFENNNIQEIEYLKTELYQLDLAYAISIHKSQGSEAEHVVLVVDGNEDFLSKELIYTAITRAKKDIILISKYDLDFYSKLQTNNNRLTNLNNVIKSY